MQVGVDPDLRTPERGTCGNRGASRGRRGASRGWLEIPCRTVGLQRRGITGEEEGGLEERALGHHGEGGSVGKGGRAMERRGGTMVTPLTFTPRRTA